MNTNKKKQQNLLSINFHLNKKLDAFKNVVSLGFSDENYTNAAVLYKEIQKHLSLEEGRMLGEAWRNTYVDPNFLDNLNDICDTLKK